jgi:homoserine kinase
MKSIKIFSPATVANLSCGFDVLGLCLDNIGDEMTITKTDTPGVRITKITGADLPMETEKNVAGVAALAMLSQWQTDFGFDIEINKKIRAGSGIGSSAASAAGAVFGINELLGRPFDAKDLVWFGGWGENLASGSYHADNVAPALLGGFTLIRGYEPIDIIRIDGPPELQVVIIHPQIEVKTAAARAILKKEVSLKTAVAQWGNVGGLIAGLYTNDYELIGRSLHDGVAEPYRKKLIPGFDQAKKAALAHGALGAGISGSGPSIFALCKGVESATAVAAAMSHIYDTIGLDYNAYISPINPDGIKILNKQ